ncbi:MAG: DUF692 domain-containing protein [Variibacter sp.]
MTSAHKVPLSAGVGLRLPHLSEVVASRPPVAWFEIHAENFLANPHACELLDDIARDYPISVHTVGVSIGSATGIDMNHLKRVRGLVDKINPILVSGHMAWSTHAGEYLNDLLPLPYDDETLGILVSHIDAAQNALGRAYLIENPSSYVGFGNSTMTEVEFLSELVARTGCRLLCDVSNVHLSAHNMKFDAFRYIDGLPADAIGELHLGGFTPEDDEGKPGATVLVDTHGAAIADSAWNLYAYALRRFGPKPTLIEWDNDIPLFSVLLAEANHADEIAENVLTSETRRAG